MDPATIAAIANVGIGLLRGGGGQTRSQGEIDFYTSKLRSAQRSAQDLENLFTQRSADERFQQLQTQGRLGRLGLQQGQFGLNTARDLRGRLQGFLNEPGFDTSGLLTGLQQQFGEQSKNIQSNFARRGFGQGGTVQGALANQFAQQVSLPFAQIQQQAFQGRQRNRLGALGQLGGLT